MYTSTIEGTPEGGIFGSLPPNDILFILGPMIGGFGIAGLCCLCYRCLCKRCCEQRAANEMQRLRMLAQPIVCENCGHEMRV